MRGAFKGYLNGFKCERMSLDQVIRCYSGRKRKTYMQAKYLLQRQGLTKKDGEVNMFVKEERLPEEDVDDKAPRAIQYRSPKYTLTLATYLKPLEETFYHLPGLGPTRTRVVTKGMNKKALAKLLIEKSEAFSDPVFVELDHSRFDSTVSVDHLKMEHWFYNSVYKDTSLKLMLRHQLCNKGWTRHGIRYKVNGTRMSGDYNTGLGNSLINRATIESAVAGVKHELMVDGDDSVLILEARDLGCFDVDHFRRFGFKTKIFYKTKINEVEYCRARLVSSVPVMCRDPLRVFSNMGTALRYYGPVGMFYWLNAVFACEYASNPNMPIYCAFKPFTKMRMIRDEDFERKMEGQTFDHGDLIDRVGFWETWSISPDQQRRIESTIGTITRNIIKVQNVKYATSAFHSIRAEIYECARRRRNATPTDATQCRLELGQERF